MTAPQAPISTAPPGLPGNEARALAGLGKPVAACAAIGGALLVVSQFLALYHTHVAGFSAPVASGTVGGAHGWAVIPIGVFAVVFGLVYASAGSRPALLAVGVLGAAALAIALGHDLSAARAHGLRFESGAYATAINTPVFGFYVETAGALVLLAGSVCAFVLLGSPRDRESLSPRKQVSSSGNRMPS